MHFAFTAMDTTLSHQPLFKFCFKRTGVASVLTSPRGGPPSVLLRVQYPPGNVAITSSPERRTVRASFATGRGYTIARCFRQTPRGIRPRVPGRNKARGHAPPTHPFVPRSKTDLPSRASLESLKGHFHSLPVVVIVVHACRGKPEGVDRVMTLGPLCPPTTRQEAPDRTLRSPALQGGTSYDLVTGDGFCYSV